MKDNLPQGYVQLPSEEVRDACRRKLASLREAEAQEHERCIERIQSWNPARRYFWRPWKIKPAMTPLQARAAYAAPRDFRLPSRRSETEAFFKGFRERVHTIEGAAGAADTVWLSLREFDFLTRL